MISPEELADLLVGAPVGVMEQTYTHPMLRRPTTDEVNPELPHCSRCGHAGPFSEKKPVQLGPWVPKSKLNSERITVRQLMHALDRCTIAILEHALCLATSVTAPNVEVIVIDCLVCGHQTPQLLVPRESPSV